MAEDRAASCGLAPIVDLSSEDDQSSHADVEFQEVQPRKGKKRFRDGPKLKERLTDPQAARNLASRTCGGKCRKLCLKQFQRGELFAKLVEFRKYLSELHKLDADRLVPSLDPPNKVIYIAKPGSSPDCTYCFGDNIFLHLKRCQAQVVFFVT